jgi:hypothetical protein
MSFIHGTSWLSENPTEPYIKCDSCGKIKYILNCYGYPYLWFLSTKSPRNWHSEFDKTVGKEHRKIYRTDYCPDCYSKEE